MNLYQKIALGFALFLVLIVLSADFGWMYGFFRLMARLPYSDTLGHFMLLGTLSLLVSLSFPTPHLRLNRLAILKSSLIIAGIITLEEFSQLFLANRTFSLLDLSANYAGIWLLGELGAVIRNRRQAFQP